MVGQSKVRKTQRRLWLPALADMTWSCFSVWSWNNIHRRRTLEGSRRRCPSIINNTIYIVSWCPSLLISLIRNKLWWPQRTSKVTLAMTGRNIPVTTSGHPATWFFLSWAWSQVSPNNFSLFMFFPNGGAQAGRLRLGCLLLVSRDVHAQTRHRGTRGSEGLCKRPRRNRSCFGAPLAPSGPHLWRVKCRVICQWYSGIM